jgi:transposase
MLISMTEADWTIVLQIFGASRSRRGDKGRDDRMFLEALHYFVIHNITWRALPARFGAVLAAWRENRPGLHFNRCSPTQAVVE